tara:strand:- start:524 stop:664 length:141 start_codon:yes stop_codon:yes gene_type:complete
MGVAKLALDPTMTATTKGLGSIPQLIAMLIAKGVITTATALLETIS